MINLLPPLEKKALKSEITKNLVIVLWYMFIIFLVALSLVLFSVKFYILQDENSQKVVLDLVKKQYETPESLSAKELIVKYNASLLKVDDFYKKEVYFSEALKTILETQRPAEVYFTNISMEKSKNGAGVKITILGTSDTRDNLLVFKDNIEANPKIKNAYFPPANWVKPKDIIFNLTLDE